MAINAPNADIGMQIKYCPLIRMTAAIIMANVINAVSIRAGSPIGVFQNISAINIK